MLSGKQQPFCLGLNALNLIPHSLTFGTTGYGIGFPLAMVDITTSFV